MRSIRLWTYVALILALACIALLTPGAWATPDQQGPGGTVPTITPQGGGSKPTPIVRPPSETPVPSPEPGQPPAPPPAPGPEATSGAAPLPTVQPTAATGLELEVVADPPMAWPDATVRFTTTLTNRSSAIITQILLTQTLSQGLAPVARPEGAAGTWQGQELRVEIPLLPPGQPFVIPFAATVDRGLPAGTVLQTVAVARAAGGHTAYLQTLLPLPPSELPRTGDGQAWPAWIARYFVDG